MSDNTGPLEDDLLGGDLPAMDPDLAAWLASAPRPTMPEPVWEQLSAALAAEPPMTVRSLDEARERRASRRWLPAVGAAAGAILVGAVVVPLVQGGIAAGPAPQAPVTAAAIAGDKAPESGLPLLAPTSPTPVTAAPQPEDSATLDPAPTAAPTQQPTSEPTAEPVDAPARIVLASGTEYSATTLTEQVDGLLVTTGYVDSSRIATVQSTPMASAPAVVGSDGFTATSTGMAECLTALAETPLAIPALVVDRARFDGDDAAVVVMVHSIVAEAAGPEVTLDVFVIGPECTEKDRSQATWYLHAMP